MYGICREVSALPGVGVVTRAPYIYIYIYVIERERCVLLGKYAHSHAYYSIRVLNFPPSPLPSPIRAGGDCTVTGSPLEDV